MDSRVERMADTLVRYSAEVRPGDWVVIQTSPLAADLATACTSAVLRAGGNPTVLLETQGIAETILREGSDEQLRFVSPVREVIVARADASIRIGAPANTQAMASIPAGRMAIQQRADGEQQAIWSRRAADSTLKWVGALFPTEAGAQNAGMSLREYQEFVYHACLLDRPDPIQAWRALHDDQQRLIDWLVGKRTIRVQGPGTDLTVQVTGRTWINSDGHHNFPSGEIFTGPVEDATEGEITFSYPAFQRGREVSGIRLVFRQGKVIQATATSGEDFLQEMLELDPGARRLGEFAFGTNYGIQRFTRNTLFDEKIGGTLHMALGRAYLESGGTNQSALHWDMVYDLRQGAVVTVDGTVFSQNGQFTI